ncbi:hypothetical protein M5361_13780 [Ligilactobacillus agilis]|nr:hypothetical protein [Ligilactobacillus agilis]
MPFRKVLLVTLMSSAILLTACESRGQEQRVEDFATHHLSYRKMVAKCQKEGQVYKLAYFENRANDNIDIQYFSLGYYKNGKIISKDLSSKNVFKEIIDPNIKTPYVVKYGGIYYIHRPPYSLYNQDELQIGGKVSGKSTE